MNKNQKIGTLGEDIACNFIKKKKYKILERNYRRKWGELDIIALAPDKTLVFFEVKTLRFLDDYPNSGLKPEDQLTRDKLKKIQRIAYGYANGHPKLISNNRGWRIDLIAIDIKEDQLYGEPRCYENI